MLLLRCKSTKKYILQVEQQRLSCLLDSVRSIRFLRGHVFWGVIIDKYYEILAGVIVFNCRVNKKAYFWNHRVD